MSGWYSLYTHARAEHKALINLRQQGFDAYLPQWLKRRSHARRVDMVPSPLFPRYLFVNLDLDRAPWRRLSSTIGVDHVVGFNGYPARIPAQVIDEIRRRENDSGFIDEPGARLGGPLRLTDGPLKDVEAIFLSSSDEERVVILMELMGRPVRTTVPRKIVAPA